MECATQYSTGIVPREIDLPDGLIKFYMKRGIFVKNLPSYELIEGKGAMEPGVDAYTPYSTFNCITYPIRYKEERYKHKAEHRTKRMILNLCKANNLKSEDITINGKEYMLNGRTKPIKIRSKIDGRGQVYYVKKPSVARVFGNALYNIVSGTEDNIFCFNKYAFVGTETKGAMLDEGTVWHVRKHKTFLENIIRADTIDWFLSVNDLESLRNFVVDDLNVHLVDFDCLMEKDDKQRGLLDFMIYMDYLRPTDKQIAKIRRSEKKRIRHRIYTNQKHFDNLVDLMSGISEFNDVAEAYHDIDGGIKEYFKERCSQLL